MQTLWLRSSPIWENAVRPDPIFFNPGGSTSRVQMKFQFWRMYHTFPSGRRRFYLNFVHFPFKFPFKFSTSSIFHFLRVPHFFKKWLGFFFNFFGVPKIKWTSREALKSILTISFNNRPGEKSGSDFRYTTILAGPWAAAQEINGKIRST